MRLIDADKLIGLIDDDIASIDKNMTREGYDVCLCTLEMIKQYIKALPTVEPTKHGRWLPSDKGDCTYTCSECGFVRDAYILEEKAYCPNCGTRMDAQIGEDKSHPFAESVMMGMDEVEE